MSLVMSLLILALVVVIAFFIIDRIPLPPDINWIVKLIAGVLFLIALLDMLFGIGGGFTHGLKIR